VQPKATPNNKKPQPRLSTARSRRRGRIILMVERVAERELLRFVHYFGCTGTTAGDTTVGAA
jgi:hypothetical protein